MIIMRTADSLCALISRSEGLAKLPTPPTACAVFMLAMEAEIQKQVPHAGVLAQILGARYGTAKGTVMQRYKLIYDVVEKWIREVPWLDAHERKKGRSVVAKRVVVARGLKDVLQFQEEIWMKKLEAHQESLPQLNFDITDTEDSQDGEDDADEDGQWRYLQDTRRSHTENIADAASANTSSTSPNSTKQELIRTRPIRMSYKSSHEHAIARASRFLLDPLRQTARSGSGYGSAAQSSAPRLRKPSGPADLDLLSHILTADVAHLPHVFANVPSRLQILAARATKGDIPDEELFADGELEGLIRTAEEAGQLQTALGWDGEDGSEDPPPPPKRSNRKRKRMGEDADGAEGPSKGTRRINMDALAQLLNPDMDLEAAYGASEYDFVGDDDADDDGDDERAPLSPAGDGGDDDHDPPSRPVEDAGDGEIVEEWRPMSPGGRGFDDDWCD